MSVVSAGRVYRCALRWPRVRVERESQRSLEPGACSLPARLSTTEPPPFCHSLPPFSAVNLRFGHASFVGKMRSVLLLLALTNSPLRMKEMHASFISLYIFV